MTTSVSTAAAASATWRPLATNTIKEGCWVNMAWSGLKCQEYQSKGNWVLFFFVVSIDQEQKMPGSLRKFWCGPVVGQWSFTRKLLNALSPRRHAGPCESLLGGSGASTHFFVVLLPALCIPANGLNINSLQPLTGQLELVLACSPWGSKLVDLYPGLLSSVALGLSGLGLGYFSGPLPGRSKHHDRR